MDLTFSSENCSVSSHFQPLEEVSTYQECPQCYPLLKTAFVNTEKESLNIIFVGVCIRFPNSLPYDFQNRKAFDLGSLQKSKASVQEKIEVISRNLRHWWLYCFHVEKAYLLWLFAYKHCFLLPDNPCSDNYFWYSMWMKRTIKEERDFTKVLNQKRNQARRKKDRESCKLKRINYQQESELF